MNSVHREGTDLGALEHGPDRLHCPRQRIPPPVVHLPPKTVTLQTNLPDFVVGSTKNTQLVAHRMPRELDSRPSGGLKIWSDAC